MMLDYCNRQKELIVNDCSWSIVYLVLSFKVWRMGIKDLSYDHMILRKMFVPVYHFNWLNLYYSFIICQLKWYALHSLSRKSLHE